MFKKKKKSKKDKMVIHDELAMLEESGNLMLDDVEMQEDDYDDEEDMVVQEEEFFDVEEPDELFKDVEAYSHPDHNGLFEEDSYNRTESEEQFSGVHHHYNPQPDPVGIMPAELHTDIHRGHTGLVENIKEELAVMEGKERVSSTEADMIRFREYSEAYVNAIAEDLNRLATLANSCNYTAEDIESIFNYIRVAVNATEEEFRSTFILIPFVWNHEQ